MIHICYKRTEVCPKAFLSLFAITDKTLKSIRASVGESPQDKLGTLHSLGTANIKENYTHLRTSNIKKHYTHLGTAKMKEHYTHLGTTNIKENYSKGAFMEVFSKYYLISVI